MPLIVEDGSGLPNADSFVSLDDANTFFSHYGGFWTGENSAKESALRRATAFLSSSIKWHGQRTHGREQSLAWPRSGVSDCDGNSIPDDIVPQEVIIATLAAASYELQYPGGLTPSINLGQAVLKEKVDVIEVTYKTADQIGLKNSDPISAMRPVLSQIIDYLRCMANISGTNTPWPVVL